MPKVSAVTPDKFATFGDLLKYLRRRAGLTQRELSIAVGYSVSQISRLEQNQRAPDEATLAARFVPGLQIEHETEWVKRLLELAAASHQALATELAGEARPPVTPSLLDWIVHGRLVARERELAETTALWQKALNGESRVLLISGEPGIGKTRLVRELITHAGLTRGAVLMGECYAEGNAPYAPLAQVIQFQFSNSLTPHGASNLPPLVLADLITLAPDLRVQHPDVPPNPPLDPQAEQGRLFESFVKFCAVLTAHAPVLLALEDVHWADSGTLALLRHLARRASKLKFKLLAVLTYREAELDESPALTALLADLNRERLTAHIKLMRLTRDQTRDLLAAMFEEDITSEFLDGIYDKTEGNPFFVEEVCKGLIEEGKLYREKGRWRRPGMDEIHVPQSVRETIRARVGKLAPPAQEVLRLAAILGREFDFETLQAASGQSEEALIDAVEAAERAQIVTEVRQGGRLAFAFTHVLFPATLRESLSGLRRQRLHRRVLAAIESLHPENYDVLAYHATQGGDEARARHFYTRAGDRALAAYAYQQAESHFRAALELVGTSSQPERSHLLAGLGNVLYNQFRFREAVQAYREAIGLCQALGDYDTVARLYARASHSLWHSGDVAGGLALCREGLAALNAVERQSQARASIGEAASQGGQLETPGLAELLHEVGRECWFNGLVDEVRPLCERALQIAERLGLVEVHVDVLATLGLLPDQSYEAKVQTLARGVELAEAARVQGLPANRARSNLAATLFNGGDIRAGLQLDQQNVERARQAGSVSEEIWAMTQTTNELLELGELEAMDELRLTLHRLMSDATPSHIGTLFRANEAMLARYRGEVAEAIRALESARDEIRRGGEPYMTAMMNNWLADASLEVGRVEAAVGALQESLRLTERGAAYFFDIWAGCLLCAARVREGDLPDARRLLDAAHAKAGPQPALLSSARLTLAQARLTAAEGNWPEALAAFEAAAGLEAQMGRRWYHAQTLCEWAEAHLTRLRPPSAGNAPGDVERARELLNEALSEFEAINAPEYALQVKNKLQRLSHR